METSHRNGFRAWTSLIYVSPIPPVFVVSNLFGKEISVRRTIVLYFQEIELTDPIVLGHELRFSPFLAEVFLHFFVDNI